MFQWHLEKRKLSSLKDYHKNPRQLSKDQAKHLQTSLEKFGLADKPIINTDGTIIGGHQRKRILKQLGYKEIECWVPDHDLSEKEIEEFNIRLNKNTGDWDYDILANQWDHEELIEWGFTIEELLGESETSDEPEGSEDETDQLEPGKDEDAITKLGDVYELISESNDSNSKLHHRISCGDSTIPDVVERLLNANKPILMVTDPPYGVNHDPSWRDDYCIGKRGFSDKHANSKGKVLNDDRINWSEAWILFPGSIAYVWHAGKYSSEVDWSLHEAGFETLYQIIWAKQHFSFGRGDYHWHHEPCWYSIKKGSNHNWNGDRKQTTLWDIQSLNPIGQKGSEEKEQKTGHSTQKPLECMARPIRNNSAVGEGVYDPFLGSGTTLIAAESLNRTCYGIELSPAYCDIIVNRWINYMKKKQQTFYYKEKW